jgi:hypothetical protein
MVTPKRRSTQEARKASGVTGAGINAASAQFYIVPVAGYVTFNRHLKEEPTDTYGIRSPWRKRLRLSANRLSRLNQLQRSANAAGMLVGLFCPIDGELLGTRRTAELDEGIAAECSKCGKQWLAEDQ